jgi:hypothetical protein
MKQKYTIIKDDKNKQLIIREFAELNKDMLSLLCEETYDQRAIKSAIKTGKDELIGMLRTNNLYPPGLYAARIANAVIELYGTKNKESVDLFFDDIELLMKKPETQGDSEQIESDTEDLDELLEEDFESDYPEKEGLKKLNSSLKIADDDYTDMEDET